VLFGQADEDLAIKVRMRLPGLPRYYALVTHDLLRHELAAGMFHFESNMLVTRQASARREPGRSEDLDTMAEREDPLPAPLKFANQLEQSSVVPQVFRSTAPEKQDSIIVTDVHIFETDVRLQAIPWAFDIGVPPGLEIVHYEV